MPGTLIRIVTSHSREARDVVTKLKGVGSVLIVGDGVHAVVDDAARRIPELEMALRASAIAATEIVRATPSVEDVLIALLQREASPHD